MQLPENFRLAESIQPAAIPMRSEGERCVDDGWA